jgi:hypothetical protein
MREDIYKTDGGDVGSESSGEIRWVLYVEHPQISPLLQNAKHNYHHF